MKSKSECEMAIRQLSHQWARDQGITPSAERLQKFYKFRLWLIDHHYGHFLKFPSPDPIGTAELWFDEEMKQSWRN